MSKGNRLEMQKKLEELENKVKQLENAQKNDEKLSHKEKLLLATAIMNFLKALHDIVEEFIK